MSFRSFGLGGKLVGIVALTTLLMVGVLVVFSSSSIVRILEREAHREMELDNLVVASMLDVLEKSALADVQRVHKMFLGYFDGHFRADTEKVMIGKKSLPVLYYNDESITGSSVLIDRFTARTGEIGAVLAKSGEEFVWVSSSLKGEDVLGTAIDRNHPAYAKLQAGQGFSGLLTIAGKMRMAHYEPLLSPEKKVIGATFSSVDLTESLNAFKQRVKSLKIGATGYVYIMDSAPGKDQGKLLVHPSIEGKNLLNVKDANGYLFVQDMMAKREGEVRYWWKNKDETEAREKIVLYQVHNGFNWMICGGGYVDDIYGHVFRERIMVVIPGIVLGVLFCFIFFNVVRRVVLTPIGDAAQLAEQLSHGDLTARATIQRDDEMGRLLRSINGIGQGLSGIVTQVRDAADAITTCSEKIADGNTHLAQRTDQGAGSLEQTAASLEELTAMVKQNADNATLASKLASSASDVATRGGDAVARVVNTMQDINASSRKINDIITVIDGIAFQTNILALNAAVEAARAGEQGRGFAVVASEVRSLAQRSAEAAKEIKLLIQASTSKVELGYATVEEAGETIKDVVKQSQQVQSLISEISLATHEQSQGVVVVNNAVIQIDQGMQQNASLVEEATDAAKSLREQAIRLSEIVGTFKIR